jgi:hypothetical protein
MERYVGLSTRALSLELPRMFPIGREGKHGQHGMKKLQCQQTLVAGLHRAWLARAVAGLAVLSASDATAQPSAKPSDAEICDCVAQALAADIELARCYSLVLEELAETIYFNETLDEPSAGVAEKLFAAIDAEEARAPHRRLTSAPKAGVASV